MLSKLGLFTAALLLSGCEGAVLDVAAAAASSSSSKAASSTSKASSSTVKASSSTAKASSSTVKVSSSTVKVSSSTAKTSSSTAKASTTATATTTAAKSLVTAGTFESDNWGNWLKYYESFGSSYSVVTPGYAGGYAGQTTAVKSGYMWLEYPTIVVTPGMLYNFSMYYKTNSSEYCDTRLENDEGTFLWLGYEGTSIADNEWAQYSVSFISSDTSERLYLLHSCSSSSSGTAHYDNIQLISGGPTIYKAGTSATGANLVTAPNFKDGTFDSYEVSVSNAVATVIKPGWNGNTYAAKVNLTNSGYEQAYGYISQTVPTVKNKVYRVTLAYMYETALAAECEVAVVLQVGNVYQQALQITSAATTAAGGWGVAKGIVTSVNGNDELLIQAICNGGVSQVFHFGDIQVLPLN